MEEAAAAARASNSSALPEAFLDFLKLNEIDPSIYTTSSHSTPRYIRVKPGYEAEIEAIEAEINCELKKVEWLPGFYSLRPDIQIANSNAYREGKLIHKIYGIDAASGAAVSALDISAGDHVVDLCVAPGESGLVEDVVSKEFTSRKPWKERKEAARIRKGGDVRSGVQHSELIYYGCNSVVIGLRKSELYETFSDTEFLSCGYDTDLMAKQMKPKPFNRQLRDAFEVLDKDATGFVSVSELYHILTSIGEKLEPYEFDEWIREVDVGSDGKIKYDDFIIRMAAK